MTEATPGAAIAARFGQLRVVGVVIVAITATLAVMLGAWPLAIGLVLGAVVTLGWVGHLVRRSLGLAHPDRIKARLADRSTILIAVVVGTVPAGVVGVVVLLIGLRHRAAFVPAGFFLALALGSLLTYMAIWSGR